MDDDPSWGGAATHDLEGRVYLLVVDCDPSGIEWLEMTDEDGVIWRLERLPGHANGLGGEPVVRVDPGQVPEGYIETVGYRDAKWEGLVRVTWVNPLQQGRVGFVFDPADAEAGEPDTFATHPVSVMSPSIRRSSGRDFPE